MSPDRGSREPLHSRASYYRVPKRARRWLVPVVFAGWLVLGAAAAMLFGGYVFIDQTLQEAAPDTPEARAARRVTRPVLPGKPVNLLLIGSDSRPADGDSGRSDSLILVRMDSKSGFISMLSFPRDLYVNIPGFGVSKINNAYGWGGPAKSIETVSELTGEDINEYVVIDFKGFERLVDTVGGVYIDVDRRYFNDNSGSGPSFDAIDLEPGYQKLSGAPALDYVRYRHTDSDFARIARQQQFLSDLKRQTNQLGNLTKLTSFRKIFGANLETSINDVRRFLGLLELALTTEKDRIARVAVSGTETMRGGASVVIAAPADVKQKVAEWKEPEFLNQGGNEKVVPARTVVTVLNGSGRALAADQMTRVLRAKGYDARVGGNADDFSYEASAVFYKAGKRNAGKALQALVGGNTTIAQIQSEEAGGSDAVVVVGTGFAGELAPPPPPPPKRVPDVTPTESLVPVLRRVQQATGLPVLVPLKVARTSSVRRVRPYFIKAGKGKGAASVKIVFEAGYHKYWGMSMTTLKDPAILEGKTGVIKTGGREYFTYYDGRNLMRLAWQKDGVTYWISNTLDYQLTPETIQEIAKSTRQPARAKLKAGIEPVDIEVELDAPTP